MFLWKLINIKLLLSVAYALKAPEIKELWATEPPGMYITWDMAFYESSHIVTGFKINIWSVKMSTNKKFDLVNADEYPGLVQDDVPLDKYDLNNTLSTIPRVVRVPRKEDITEKVYIPDIEYNVIYEVRLQGVKGDEESPMSAPRRIKIIKGEGYHVILQKMPTGCLLSIPSVSSGRDRNLVLEDYLFVEDSFF